MAAFRNRRGFGKGVAISLGMSAAIVLALGPSAGASISVRTLWLARYNGQGKNIDEANSVTLSPDGSKVFVTGTSIGASGDFDYATVAYDASTGARLWVKRYNDSSNLDDTARSVVASPEGSTVYVTGEGGSGSDYATVAYDASTGATLWVERYRGPGNQDSAYSIVATRDGSKVFVTGLSAGPNLDGDYATVAYGASTGARLWVKRYNGQGNSEDAAYSVAASPDGSRVFVTGEAGDDYATVAYDASTGATLWVKRYSDPRNGFDSARSLAVSPDGSKVFVTGSGGGEYATLAYDASTGAKLWIKRYNGPGDSGAAAWSLVASSDGSKVFVTGGGGGDYATVAYDASTGATLWVERFNGPGNGSDIAYSVAVSFDGSRVFVTGNSIGDGTGSDYATVGYDASTGAKLWIKRYNGPRNRDDSGKSIAASPDGSKVFVTGGSNQTGRAPDYLTLAYIA